MRDVTQVRVLALNRNENRQTTLYRLQKDWVLRFVLGPSLLSSSVKLFCNHPPPKQTFKRTTYYEIPWRSPRGMKSDRHDVMAEVCITVAGSFNFFFTIDHSDDPDNANGLGYFLVDPTLSIGQNKEEISLDCIQCQTVITKLLGKLPQWESRLRVSKETGYNLIHFTPIQELGLSNSAYSIRDQRLVSSAYSDQNTYTYEDVEKVIKHMKEDWGVLSLTDLVFNHTSRDSTWLRDHPESAFNLDNSAHLRPAYILDRIFCQFSEEVSIGKWEARGIPSYIDHDSHLEAIRHIVMYEVLPSYRLSEFFCISISKTIRDFKKGIEDNLGACSSQDTLRFRDALEIIQDPTFQRNGCSVDITTALHIYNIDKPGVVNRDDRIAKCCECLVNRLYELNEIRERDMLGNLSAAVDNFLANIRWRFLDGAGPRFSNVSKENSLVDSYFVWPETHNGNVDRAEMKLAQDEGCYVMAVNGWVMNDDPLRNFAGKDSNVYFRRELLAWGDSVKLRYGDDPEDSPFLWELMRDYATTTARIFHGVRLDNCHSTPIHVAEYMIDAARKIRPDLYVIAELFTGGEHLDNLFINRLGINSLIREALQAPDAHEEGRLVYRYGGLPVGAFVQPRVMPLVSTVAHAIFFDQTHDNESATQRRSPFDLWPSSGLIAMACCATGSTRGYDQLVPHLVDVVTENRLYPSWTEQETHEPGEINQNFGITYGKKLLNAMHYRLGNEGFSQVYVDQLDTNVVSVTRHNPSSHDSVVMVARTAFQYPHDADETGFVKNITIQGMIEEIMFEGRVRKTENFSYVKNEAFINGLPDYFLELRTKININESKMVSVEVHANTTEVSFHTFTPGSVVVFRTTLPPESKLSILEIRKSLGQFGYLMRSYSGHTVFEESWKSSNFRNIVSELTLADLNYVLYRVGGEEQDDGNGFGSYHIPNHGSLVYCGLRGIVPLFAEIRPHNDLGHPLCVNLREGDWLANYVANRLKVHHRTKDLGLWFENVFSHLKTVPRYLYPSYFDAIIQGSTVVLREMGLQLFSSFIRDGSTFAQGLAMGSIQFCGFVRTSKLPPLSPNLKPPGVRTEVNMQTEETEVAPLTLSAGFPHFANGYMRNWGRDTFISLRGLLLLTGRFEEARSIILGFAGTMRHGLIPNLLNEGSGARYNCRDATWWWLQAIQDYVKMAPQGVTLFQDVVSRLYPTDESDMLEAGQHDQPLHEVIHDSLTRHAEGICYRERGAGTDIDAHMCHEGFNVEVGVQWDTGFVFGGNEHNCGTWMDKMGSSDQAGNKGKPATPRDGSAVELVGLSMSTLRWLTEMNKAGHYPLNSVIGLIEGEMKPIAFSEWADLIRKNFEKHFWIPETISPDDPARELINRHQIYKDSFQASQPWTDFQLRPNFTITMVVAPELFDIKNAWAALNVAEDVLLGPLGMKTLDPSDWAYDGDYHNDNNGNDPKVAHGWNYHQGPEWVWPIGFFLRAKLYFAGLMEQSTPGVLRETVCFVEKVLGNHYEEIMKSPWQSLPELTNSSGSYCQDSCRAQAWSVACILEVLSDLNHIHRGAT